MTNELRAAAEQLLSAADMIAQFSSSDGPVLRELRHATNAMRDALAAEQPSAEPYAWLVELPSGEYAGTTKFFTAPSDPRGFPVYRTPPPAPAEQPQPSVGVQACRPEDRAMLATPAGAELVAKVAQALAAPKAVTDAPPRIWLQISDDAADMDEPFPESAWMDATWCWHSATDAEVEYVRADLAAAPPAAAPSLTPPADSQGGSNSHQTAPSEAMIDAANEALYRVLFDPHEGTVLDLRRSAMRAAIDAALAAREGR